MKIPEFKSAIVKQSRLLPGIHGLRGLAALSVVLYHLQLLGGIVPSSVFKFIGRDFGFSVHLFFILSAFSLMYSTDPRISHRNWISAYFVKRFFRIAPLFYLIVAFQLARQISQAGAVFNINHLFLNLTFTFGFVPFSHSQFFIWGGWSVGVEMIFYCVFPIILLTVRTHKSAALMLIISIAMSYLLRLELHEQYQNSTPKMKWDFSYFAFPSNFCFFAMGIYAYYLSHHVDGKALQTLAVGLVSVTAIAGLMLFDAGYYLHGSGRWDIVIWGLSLMMLCVWQSVAPSLLIANRVCEYLGERSFSIYLLHPIVIIFSKVHLNQIYSELLPYTGANAFFICAALITIFILVFAECTYRLVEVPGIRLGKKLIQNRKTA